MLVDRETAEKISAVTSEHFYSILLKEKKLSRVVNSDSIKNIISNEKFNFNDSRKIVDLSKEDILEKLSRIADISKVDSLLISIIKKCETNIVFRNLISTGRKDFGESQNSMSYSYVFELETGIFSANEKKIVWIGESRVAKSNRTSNRDQDLLVALVTNKLEKFFKKFIIEKVLNEEPEYQCALKIVNTLP
ncbi:MAG: hypothetical protein A2539_01700 [Elusimicrobia bacterium RIFOXYD2_FULL_34_15]|nr:MAG: hypothetical protein A2539_01700 [Elusimicrobia bacterium RIFOXYD2_FULL_34_15]